MFDSVDAAIAHLELVSKLDNHWTVTVERRYGSVSPPTWFRCYFRGCRAIDAFECCGPTLTAAICGALVRWHQANAQFYEKQRKEEFSCFN